ncbi:anti-sigma factor [Marivita sp.]|uniref:anti-sigma factor n=1 Tax=Marivita sp. TaxID=2003365 RepID=UPI0025BB20AD|nr:anti-sigma factor [Marivita sp.]
MSDKTNPPEGPEEDEPRVLAAEYALGLLPNDERVAFEARMAEDQALRDEVAAWDATFAELIDDVEEVPPSPQLRKRLEARLFGARRPSIWQQVWPYAVGGIAAAVVLWFAATSGVLVTDDEAVRADLVAELAATPDGDGLDLRANVDTTRGAVQVLRSAGDPPEGRVFELWLIAGNNAPVSLGLLDGDGDTVIDLPQDLLASLPGAVLAISDEPPGGSPTGAPTGAVRAAGPLTAS